MYSMYHLDWCLSREICQISPLKVCLAKALMVIYPYLFSWEFKNNFVMLSNIFSRYGNEVYYLMLFQNFPLKQDSIAFIILLILSNSKCDNKCIHHNFKKML